MACPPALPIASSWAKRVVECSTPRSDIASGMRQFSNRSVEEASLPLQPAAPLSFRRSVLHSPLLGRGCTGEITVRAIGTGIGTEPCGTGRGQEAPGNGVKSRRPHETGHNGTLGEPRGSGRTAFKTGARLLRQPGEWHSHSQHNAPFVKYRCLAVVNPGNGLSRPVLTALPNSTDMKFSEDR